MTPSVELVAVTAGNWRACADLSVRDDQAEFVAQVTRYLCLCHYDRVWQPLAVFAGGDVVGFAMWAVDPDDGAGWIGGLVIGREHQRHGYGRAAMLALIERLGRDLGCPSAALSYSADNVAARSLYRSLGFVETGEREDEELVARLTLPRD